MVALNYARGFSRGYDNARCQLTINTLFCGVVSLELFL